VAIIVVAVIVIAALAVAAIYYTGTGTISVSTPGTVVAAQDTVNLTADISAPALVSAGPVDWNFGDGGNVSGGSASQTHSYQFPGEYFIWVGSTLGNGKRIDNSQRLFEMQVVQPNVANPNPLGSTASYAVLVVNKTASSTGAPNLPSGGHLAYAADIQQEPTFFYATEVNTTTNTWTNYTWAVNSMVINYGDGSAAVTNATTDPFNNPLAAYTGLHTYSTDGIYTMTVAITTQNYSSTQINGGTPSNETGLAGQSNSITTKVAQTITVGSYSIPAITIQNPGTIINMEAETGGYFSLDPSLDYESVGFEIIANVYETLLAYNGTQTNSFVPVIADTIPTVANGGISTDYMNYTFHIRQGLHFTYNNGQDAITPWDVKYSITRTMIFDSGSPFPPGWIVSQFLVPGTFVPNPIDQTTFDAINNAITVDNTTQTVTFHLLVPAPPTLFYQVVSDPLGTGVIDHKWLEANGPALVWTATGFTNYEAYSYAPTYISAWRNGAAGSGPFMIQYENNPNDVVLVPNPYFTPLPGVQAADSSVQKVILEYVGSDSVRELALQSGSADIAGISSSHFNVVNSLVSQGLIHTQFISTLNLFWWNFNMDIYQSGTSSNLYGNMVPPDFFVDINMRKAFFLAFNFQEYLNTFLGNGIYGVNFGTTYNGMVPKGMIGYQDLTAYNKYDLALAKAAYQNTTWYKTGHHGFTITINPPTADPVDENAAAAWAQNIATLDTGITVNVQAISFTDAIGNSVAWQNPMAIYFLGWLPDYPFPTDYTVPMLLPSTGAVGNTSQANGGTYPNANNLNIPYFAADPNGTNQVAQLTKMHDLIIDSITANATNVAVVVNESEQADIIDANLYLYVPAEQQNTFFSFRTWISGMNLETNPTLGGADLLYDLLTKGTGTTTTASLTTSTTSAGSAPALILALAGPLTVLGLMGTVDARRVGFGRLRKDR
jgi:peptide/nickel transport system substrate-binding protein